MKGRLLRTALIGLALCLIFTDCLYPLSGQAETAVVQRLMLSTDRAVMAVGQTCTLDELATVQCFPAVENPPLFWRVGDSSILSVSQEGLAALRPGVTYVEIVVMDEGMASARLVVTVEEGPAQTPAPEKESIFEIPGEGPYTLTTFVAAKDGRYEVRGKGDATLAVQAYHVRLDKMLTFKQESKGVMTATANLLEGDEVYILLSCDTADKPPQEMQLTITLKPAIVTQRPTQRPTPKPTARPTQRPATAAPTPTCVPNPAPNRATEAPSSGGFSPSFSIDIQAAVDQAYQEALEMVGGGSTGE